MRTPGKRRAIAIARLVAAVTVMGLVAGPRPAPGSAPAIEALVTDEKGKPVAEAVVYLAGGAAGGPSSRTAIIDQIDREFVPAVTAVEVGTAITFPNRDNIKHHVYSFSAPKKFELPLYTGTPASPVVFDRPGVVVLGCNIHDWMAAYVFVLPTTSFAKTGDDGRALIKDAPAGEREVRVWHPRLSVATETTGQTVTVGGSGPAQVAFKVALKREWKRQRPTDRRYDREGA